MEHRDIDTIKALLVICQDGNVARFKHGDLEIEFHRPIPALTQPVPRAPVVPKDPIQEQLAAKHPHYAAVLPGGTFPTHAPKTPPPKAE